MSTGAGRMNIYVAVIAVIVLLLDQLSKFAVTKSSISYSQNTGTVFGLIPDNNVVFIFVSLAILSGIIFYYAKLKEKNMLNAAAIGLIAGGAVGNLIDRIRLDGVIDFIDLRIWPLFNIADSAIVIGIALFIWGSYKK